MVQSPSGMQQKLPQFVNIQLKFLSISLDVLKAHESDITHMQWFEKDRMLITSAKEKCMKVIQKL